METANEPVRFHPKIAVVLSDDLQVWQRLNMKAFLVSGNGGDIPEVIGDRYSDADDADYLPMYRHAVLVFAASQDVLVTCHQRALARPMPLSVFTTDLFTSHNDRDNRAAVRGE